MLTETQMRIYQYIYGFTLQNGYQPSIRGIGVHFGIKSPNGVMCHLKALEKKEFVKMGGEARSLRFLKKPNGKPFQGLKSRKTRKIDILA